MRRSQYGRRKPKRSIKRSLHEVQPEGSPFLHLKRTPAELILDEGIGRPKSIFHAMLVLNELTPTGIHLFSEAPFDSSDELTLNIPSLRNFFIKGRVVACSELSLNPGILSAKSFQYRIELHFLFETEAEREAVREYCNYLKAAYLANAA